MGNNIGQAEARKFYKKGYNYYDDKDYQKAADEFEKAIKNDSQFKEALVEKGSCLFHLGRHENALEDFKKALKIDPKQKVAWTNKGTVLNKLEKYSEALEAFDKALNIDPNFYLSYKHKAFSLFKLGKKDEALETCKKAINLRPDYVDAWNLIGMIHHDLKQYKEAIAAYDIAIKYDYKHFGAQNNKSECQRKISRSKTVDIKEELRIFEEINYYSPESKNMPFKKGELKDDTYLLANYEEKTLRMIGKGSYGIVYLAKKKNRGERNIALKVVEASTPDQYKDAIIELTNLEKIGDHPNIMKHLNYYQIEKNIGGQTLNQFFIEMVLARNTLENILKKYVKLTEPEIIYITRQLCLGLKFTHDSKLAHSDLKPENILIVDQDFKIADWGGSIKLQSNNTKTIKTHIFCTKGYYAPEIDDGNPMHSKMMNFYLCDIYSLAMVILRMCGIPEEELKKTPKADIKYHDMHLNDNIFPLLSSYSDPINLLIKEMSKFVPNERKSLNDVIEFIDKNLYK